MCDTFITAINCIDGRVQEPLIQWAKERFCVDYVDMITEAGADGILSKKDSISIKKKVKISIINHNSKIIIIAGHYDCIGNPGDKKKHIKDLREAEKRIKSWFTGIKTAKVWINKEWEVEEIK